MKKILLFLSCGLLVLSGCSKDEKSDELPSLVEIVIQTPETINVKKW
ncbi:hypothetical protein [Niallia oryzisoli]